MSSSQPPAGGSPGRLPTDPLGDPVALPAETNGSDRDDNVDALERNVDATEQVGGQAGANAVPLRGEAAEKAPQVGAEAVEKEPRMTQANRRKAVGAVASVLLVLWLLRRWIRRSSRSGDGVPAALDQQARIIGDTVNALGAETASTGRAQDDVQKVRGRAAAKAQARAQAIEKAQKVRAQAIGKAQQARAQAIERAQQLREQAAEKAHAAEKAQQLAHEAQQLVHALGQRLPRR